MSIELHAFLRNEEIPDRETWQAAIDALGLPLQLNQTLDLSSDSGFSPCDLNGKLSGFEIYLDSVEELLDLYGSVATQLSGRDAVISFRFGGDLAECACPMGAAAGLKQAFDAFVYYPNDDLIYSLESLIEEFNYCLSEE